MSVSDSIYGALARFGRPMTLRRITNGPNGQRYVLDVVVKGVTENYLPEELIGTIQQGDTKVTFSNKEIAAAQWPGPPKKGDAMVIDGKTRSVASDPEPKYLGTEILVYIVRVTG